MMISKTDRKKAGIENYPGDNLLRKEQISR
ncbi:hypothetical protein BH23CYA1_BH23CYA1_23680 [soil metagenome]